MDLAIWLIVLPLLTAFIMGVINFFSKKPLKTIILISSLLHALLIIIVILNTYNNPLVYSPGDWGLLGINLVIDNFTIIMLALIALLGPLVILYSRNYVLENYSKYYILLSLMIAGVTGMAMTADLFNLYVFFEITSITSYALVAIPKKDESIEGSFKYLILGTISGIFVLLAIILTYYTTGVLSIARVAQEFSEIPLFLRQTIIVFFLFGFSLKFALIPLHSWLPDSYSGAPLPYNVLSSGLVIKVSLLVLIRILYIIVGTQSMFELGLTDLLVYWGVLTFLIAHTTAFKQKSIIRMLAYSSIAQMGYIIIAMALTTEQGLIAGSYHFINHALMKGALFFTAGIFIMSSNQTKISSYKGLGYFLPYISVAFVAAALAIVGLPPFNGFISKWLIIEAALEAEYTLAAFFIPVGSLLSLTYYLRIFKVLYSDGDKINTPASKPPWNLQLPAFLLSGLCLLLGLFPAVILKFLDNISLFLIENINYIDILLGG